MKPTLTPARFLLGATALSVALFAVPAQATIYTLAPGTSITANSSGAPVGGAIVGQVTDPYSSGIMSGTLTSTVISGDASNPYGGLDFVYQFTVAPGSTDTASQLTVSSFAGLQTDVSYNSSSGTIAPTLFSRSSSGDVLRFSFFTPDVAAGQTTELLVVQTSAHTFVPGIGAIIDGQATDVGTLVPMVVPEPGTTALLVAGLGGMALALRRKNRK
jgi:hypothetical protein